MRIVGLFVVTAVLLAMVVSTGAEEPSYEETKTYVGAFANGGCVPLTDSCVVPWVPSGVCTGSGSTQCFAFGGAVFQQPPHGSPLSYETYHISIDDEVSPNAAGRMIISDNDAIVTYLFCNTIEVHIQEQPSGLWVSVMNAVDSTAECGTPTYPTHGTITVRRS